MQWKRQLLPPSLVTSVSAETEQCVCVLKKSSALLLPWFRGEGEGRGAGAAHLGIRSKYLH
jgi:hypothetical protein